MHAAPDRLSRGVRHGSLCPIPWFNDFLGLHVSLFNLMSLSLYRAAHHSHHAYLATERDEELWPFVVPGTPRAGCGGWQHSRR